MIDNSHSIGLIDVMDFFCQLISELQNEEPHTLSYIRTLHMFKGESIVTIFQWTLDLFISSIECLYENKVTIEEILKIVDTMSACL